MSLCCPLCVCKSVCGWLGGVNLYNHISPTCKKKGGKKGPFCLSPVETKNRRRSVSATGELQSPTIWERYSAELTGCCHLEKKRRCGGRQEKKNTDALEKERGGGSDINGKMAIGAAPMEERRGEKESSRLRSIDVIKRASVCLRATPSCIMHAKKKKRKSESRAEI